MDVEEILKNIKIKPYQIKQPIKARPITLGITTDQVTIGSKTLYLNLNYEVNLPTYNLNFTYF